MASRNALTKIRKLIVQIEVQSRQQKNCYIFLLPLWVLDTFNSFRFYLNIPGIISNQGRG